MSRTLYKGQGGLAVLLIRLFPNSTSTVPSRWVCLTALRKVLVLSQKLRASSFYSKINLVSDISVVIGSVWVRVQCGHLSGVALAPESAPGSSWMDAVLRRRKALKAGESLAFIHY